MVAEDSGERLASSALFLTCLVVLLLALSDDSLLHRPLREPGPGQIPQPAQAGQFFAARMTLKVRVEREMTVKEFLRTNQLERLRDQLEALHGWRDETVLHTGEEIVVRLSPESSGLDPAR